MEVLAVVAVLVALCAVVFVVSAAAARAGREAMERQSSERVRDLEAAREAKYREIRDAELDCAARAS